MLFNSIEFLIFFPIVTALYFLLPHKHRWWLIVIASCYFYMVLLPYYIVIMFVVIIIDYLAGMLIASAEGGRRKVYLIISLAANIGILIFFKYYNFFTENINFLLYSLNISYSIAYLDLILPIGLSFHTFQSMSYTIEVYRKAQEPERHLGYYALYVMFYPQLVAGPIERPQNLFEQFRTPQNFNSHRVVSGLRLMIWGAFMKMVVADTLAVIVNNVYSNPYSYNSFGLIIGTYSFTFQIYCDFAGYSSIAIGAAQVMGINLMKNFAQPYYAASISDFWRRWHISLSTWFRDYLYIPLGGNRVAVWQQSLNLCIVFAVSGLWHGANWTFVFWGTLHGLYLVIGLLTNNMRQKLRRTTGLERFPSLHKALAIAITFHLVAFAWIFFRANNVQDAFYIATHLFSDVNLQFFVSNFDKFGKGFNLFGGPMTETRFDYIVIPSALCTLLIVDYYQRTTDIRQMWASKSTFTRWAFAWIIIVAILFMGKFGSQEFIYFQF